MTVEERVRAHLESLSPAEQRVAHEVSTHPQVIAFGTVASVAKATGTSGATVMRLAGKLGFDGFVDLQAEIQAELSSRLGPAADRIREEDLENDLLGAILRAETGNIEATMHGIDREQFDSVVGWLADSRRHVWIAAGDCLRGVALMMSDQLFALRPGVDNVDGNQLQIGRKVATVAPGDAVLVLDFARYDRSVVRVASRAADQGALVVALTDSAISPLANPATTTFIISSLGVGPFDSASATTVLCQALVAATARAVRKQAAERLAGAEAAWQALDALTGGQ